MMRTVETGSAAETFNLGRQMGQAAKAGYIFALSGDLGTGKTVFTQCFAEGLGIKEPVTSPTFTILQLYEEGRLPLYHFDLYRISEAEELDEIGCDEYFYGKGVYLVEWAELFPELFPKEAVRIRILKDPGKGTEYRKIQIQRDDPI
jgi:tRNA threonylcarbamoyladenosine biosynthesis protein TsaE